MIPTERLVGGGGQPHSVQQRHSRGQQQQQYEHDSVSPSISEGDDEELDDDEDDDEDIDAAGDEEDYQYNSTSKRNRQWSGKPISADAPESSNHHIGIASYSDKYVEGDSARARRATAANQAGPGGGSGATARAPSPRSARRLRNRLAAARMRTRQKQQLVQLEKRKSDLERRATELEGELRAIQQKNNPLNSSIEKLAEMIDDLTKVEFTMLTGIDECKGLLQNLEKLYESRQQQK
ncbi:hypothetical protein GGF44_001639 [Coemansia sp. RSA 1694]|nr:hypothetical protein GGF44_001639 [Coemansia sp. RSA 1694]